MPVPGDELEAELDAALRAYAEPAEGSSPAVLAARLFAMSAEKASLRRVWISCGFAAATACALFAVLAFLASSRVAPLPRGPQTATALLSAPDRVLKVDANRAAMRRPARASRQSVSEQASASPKLDQFPQPRPLGEQEKRMLAFVSSASPTDQKAAARAAQSSASTQIAELEFAPIRVTTLTTDNLGDAHDKHH